MPLGTTRCHQILNNSKLYNSMNCYNLFNNKNTNTMKKILTLLFLGWQFTGLQAQCANPLEDATFSQIHAGVAGINDGRDATIRDVTASNCLQTAQVGLFAQLYNVEQDRYNYLLFAKPYTFNPDQYSSLSNLLNDAGLRQQFLNQVAPSASANPNTINSNPNPVVNPNTTTNTNNTVVNSNPIPQQPEPAPFVVYVEGYTGRLGGQMPVDDATVDNWAREIQKESFDNKRLDIFKRKAAGYCLKVTQIRRLIKIFTFDTNRIHFTKEALAHCYDLDNYMSLADEFSFDSQKKEIGDHYNKNAASYVHMDNYNKNQSASSMPAYSGRTGCTNPMSDSEFGAILSIAKNQSFDQKRTTDIKAAVGTRCLSVDQVKKLAAIYTFDNYKLDFARYAYGQTFDMDNFLQLENLFSFDSDKRKLREMVK
jgi:hypothetical protein